MKINELKIGDKIKWSIATGLLPIIDDILNIKTYNNELLFIVRSNRSHNVLEIHESWVISTIETTVAYKVGQFIDFYNHYGYKEKSSIASIWPTYILTSGGYAINFQSIITKPITTEKEIPIEKEKKIDIELKNIWESVIKKYSIKKKKIVFGCDKVNIETDYKYNINPSYFLDITVIGEAKNIHTESSKFNTYKKYQVTIEEL